jgi:heavy metal translocating P-type ATPase
MDANPRGAHVSARLLAAVALLGLVAGAVLRVIVGSGPANAAWAAAEIVVLVPLAWSVVRSLRRRDVGVDAIALIAIAAALALGQYLAGAVVALMMAGGNALEEWAGRRARKELRSLVERTPRTAVRRRGDIIEEVRTDELVPGDLMVVRAGDIIAADGTVASARAIVDESILTGEPLPVACLRGDPVRSGTVNAGAAFEARVVRPSADSAYAALVRLVRSAEAEQAPFARLADRYASVFLPVTLAVAGAAWALSGDPIRALAVLVVATPCPLILAAPIAFVCGVSRAARRGVVIKGPAVVERLGRATDVLLDKTGTVTLGRPEVRAVMPAEGQTEDGLLQLAASVDQLSAHPFAHALVRAAKSRGLDLDLPDDVHEDGGEGIAGRLNGHRVDVGSRAWITRQGDIGTRRATGENAALVSVGVDGRVAGAISIADELRPDASGLVPALQAAGVHHVALVTGDARAVGEQVGRDLGVDRVYADQSPEDKLALVRSLHDRSGCGSVIMVGDGVNDAPALALADVGVAMSARGATISSETADAVIVVDRVDRVADAIRIGRRSLRIARQSVLAGMGLSILAMGFAAAGFLPPVAGALLQEGIDVAVILNALRALSG